MALDTAEGDRNQLAGASRLLRRAKHAVALTGAGLSTRSGIPDFRSPGSGLWERDDPMEVASIDAFISDPERFYAWARPVGAMIADARPNAAHQALAALEARGRLRAIITQNVDGLHQAAGSRNVLELHGNLRNAACMSCGMVERMDGLLARFLERAGVPRCASCGGVMKPDAILIGERLDANVISNCLALLKRTDVLLIAGSSLEMAPSFELPFIVHEHGGCLIVVNLGETHVDAVAEIVIHQDVVDALPWIAEHA